MNDNCPGAKLPETGSRKLAAGSREPGAGSQQPEAGIELPEANIHYHVEVIDIDGHLLHDNAVVEESELHAWVKGFIDADDTKSIRIVKVIT